MTPNRQNPFARKEEALSLASDSAQLTAADLNYDYSQLPDQHRLHVQSAAAQIKLQFKRAQNSILEIGKQLTAVKERLDHGQFGDWLHAEFSLTDRSAQRYMQAYETFGQRPDSAHLLTSSALMMLSGDTIPDEARQEAEQKAKETGKSPTKTEVKEIIEKHKPQRLSEDACYKLLSEAIATYTTADAFAWLNNRTRSADCAYLLPPNSEFDIAVFQRVRSRLIEKLHREQQPTQAPTVLLTLSEHETYAALRRHLSLMNKTMQLMWLTNRPSLDTIDEIKDIISEHQRFDSQVYRRVRKELIDELQQPIQKPSVPRSTPPASVTPATSTTPQIAPIAPATPSDLRNAVESQPDVKSLISHYTESVSLLPITKQAIRDPAFQWSYDRLQRDLRTLVQYLNQL